MPNHSPQKSLGCVYLVGAGPGDPELLTLKAVRAIATADVILVDDLVEAEVLNHRKPEARVIHVGKRGGCASTPQTFIEHVMVTEAQAGAVVVRLKGGDPFIFGRGGEERDSLLKAGIPVHVINGVTSGIAAAGTLGVSLTHRDFSHGCIFVTGHQAGAKNGIDWPALAQTCIHQQMTLVVYMGLLRAEHIQQQLIAGGMSPSTPAAAVQSATCAGQKSMITTLGELTPQIKMQNIQSPAILIIGKVVQA